MRIYNNNPNYGDGGPFEYESFEALADDMQPNFEEWAEHPDYDGYERNETIKSMRADFITGLEIVE